MRRVIIRGMLLSGILNGILLTASSIVTVHTLLQGTTCDVTAQGNAECGAPSQLAQAIGAANLTSVSVSAAAGPATSEAKATATTDDQIVLTGYDPQNELSVTCFGSSDDYQTGSFLITRVTVFGESFTPGCGGSVELGTGLPSTTELILFAYADAGGPDSIGTASATFTGFTQIDSAGVESPVTFSVVVLPEPSSLGLIALGISVIGCLARRRLRAP